MIPPGQEHVLQQENCKERFVQMVTDLSRAFALCAATDAAITIRDDIAFLQAIKVQLTKTSGHQRPPDELDAVVQQLVSSATMADEGIINVFTAAGLKKPDISILSDQFLSEVRGLKYKNVAAELLAKLLRDEISTRSPRNIVQTRQFVKAMGDAKLRAIASELVSQVRRSVTIDWTLSESAQAKIDVMVKRILNKYGYPPDMQDAAVQEVLAKAKELCVGWATAE